MLDENKELCSWCKGSGEVYSPGDTIDDSPRFERCPACAGRGLRQAIFPRVRTDHQKAIDAAVKAIEDAWKRGRSTPVGKLPLDGHAKGRGEP